jgi:hypothetical protein
MGKEFPGAIQAGVIVGGDVDDPAPDLSGNMKVWSPTEHNPANYPKADLPFSAIIQPATKSSQSEFGGVLDPSSMVATMKTSGGFPIILGGFRDFANPSKAAAGNNNAMMNGLTQYGVWDKGLGMNRPAKVSEKTEGGATVRTRDAPQEYKPSDIAGLPNHAALFNMAGHRWPQVQQIETAITHFNQVLTSDMLSQLPGQISSLASMLKGLSSNQKAQIKAAIPEDIFNAFESMTNLMPEIVGGTTFMSDFRVHPEQFANNAVGILSQVTTMADLQDALHDLDTNMDHRGLDLLANTTIELTGPFGNTNLTFTSTGTVQHQQSEGHKAAMQGFSDFLSSAGSAPSGNKGMNMFGPAAAMISDMVQRVAPETQAKLKDTLERVNKTANVDHAKFTELFQTGGAKALTSTVLSMLS